ncbi:cell wall-active antibiotics response protein LiaF [Radiobacillus sp. PE A8.2]|uniref:cell wall-active antibiotics response protein LiaF n=1 Tax=Radiobacillus sp. PE A8.2 TaxID=3380349 RepID=UPI00389078E3
MHIKGKNIIEILFIITAVLFIYELLFKGPELLILIVLFSAAAYYGRKTYFKTSGKVFFWLGVVLFIITIMNTASFKFLSIAIIIFVVYKWYQSRQEPAVHHPQFMDSEQPDEKIYHTQPLFKNKWFGSQRTENVAYEWEDINIQTGIGDAIIDLNYTVIPKVPTVIFIRNLVGNVQVHIPYGVEVSVHHSIIFGSHDILGNYENNTVNKSVHFQSADYNASNQKVKIFTSMIIGKLEVKRV